MKKVLLVDSDMEIPGLLRMVLDANLNCTIDEACDGESAVVLAKQEHYDVIISNYRLDGVTGGTVCNEVAKKNKEASCIIFFEDTVDQKDDVKELRHSMDNILFIMKPFAEKQLRFMLDHVTGEKHEDVIKDEFAFVNANIDFRGIPAGDVYFRIGDEKFIKIYSKDEDDWSKFQECRKNGADHFWIKKEAFKKIIRQKIIEIESQLKDHADEIVRPATINTLHDAVKYLGIDSQVISTSNEIVKSILHSLKKETIVLRYLANILKGDGYVFKLALMTSYISVGICEQIVRNYDAILPKLIMASLFQDIGLSTEEEASIVNIKSEEFERLSLIQQEKVKNHPEVACMIIDKISGIYFDFRNVVLRHHESPVKSHFYQKVHPHNLSEIERIFILSVDFSQRILAGGCLDQNFLGTVLKGIDEDYNNIGFKKIVAALKGIMRKTE